MMKKHTFQLMPKAFFGFFPVTEPDTSRVGPLAYTLGQAFSASVQAQKYGTGVKNITVTLILTDPEGLGRAHKVKRPKYSAGVQTIRAHGVTVSTENTLEFGLRPLFADVRNARTESEVAAALLPAIAQVKPGLQKLKVPDFDKHLFLADLENFLEHARRLGAHTH
jgi:hypothetical protein